MSRSPGQYDRHASGTGSVSDTASRSVINTEHTGIHNQMRVLSLEATVASLRAERERHLDTINRLEDEVARLDAERSVLISDLDHREAQISQMVETYERIIDEQSEETGPDGKMAQLRARLQRVIASLRTRLSRLNLR